MKDVYLGADPVGCCPGEVIPVNNRSFDKLPNPTEEDLQRIDFNRIWEVIKSWDINIPDAYSGYCGATGSHVMIILNALRFKTLKGVETLADINTESTEGKLLIATLGRLSGQPGYANRHPEETLREMVEVAKEF